MEQAAMTRKQEKTGKRKVRSGVVVSDKMDKTVVVRIDRIKKHPKYKKYFRVWMKVKAHDEKNACQRGDEVEIVETRPLSKDKRWRVTRIVKKGEVEEQSLEGEGNDPDGISP
jgi:small subunit ribosomal protein S17